MITFYKTLHLKKMNVMIDLETLSTSIDAVIIRIAAIAFDIKTGELLKEFDMKVNAKSCLDIGLKISEETIKWWINQDTKIINDTLVTSLMSSENDIKDVLSEFTEFINKLRETYKNVYIWGNGISSDNIWIRESYHKCNMKLPWKYYEDRDLRTIVYIGDHIGNKSYKDIPFEGVKHNPIDDCKHQIKYLVNIMNDLSHYE